MWFIHLFMALIIGVLLTLAFAGVTRRRGGTGAIWLFFLIVFLVSWAAGVWIRPVGPLVYDTYWIPAVVVGLIVALLIVTLIPARPEPMDLAVGDVAEAERETAEGALALGITFWILVLLLVVAIVVGYVI